MSAGALRVDVAALLAGGWSGVPRYAVSLLRALDRVAAGYPRLRLTILSTVAGIEAVAPRRLAARAIGRHLPRADAGPVRLAAEQLVVAARGVDLVHFVDLTGPVLAPRRPFTATVHDAAVARRLNPGASAAYKRYLCPWAARRARRLVAVSAFARDEAVSRFGADPARTVVVHSGPGLVDPAGPPARKLGPEEPFLLYVGTLTAAKNVPLLVDAHGRSGVPTPLVLAGAAGPGGAAVHRAVARSPARTRVHLITDASDAEVDDLYRRAAALFLPSRYEGFGFTPLEAMARGCPVVAADIPAVREVSGDGAMLLPPDDPAAWTAAMRRLAASPDARRALAARGTATAARYSWDRTARRLCEVLLDAGRELGR